MDRLQPAFARHPIFEGQGINANVDRLQILDLALCGPADHLQLDAVKHIVEVSDDAEPEGAPSRQLLKHRPQQVEVDA